MSKPQVRIRLDFSIDCSIGPGKIALLEGIERSGSLSAAARQLGMSYRRAWLLLHHTNASFQEPVAAMAVGGKDGGGAQLTEFGRNLVAQFRDLEEAVQQLAAQRFTTARPSGQPSPSQGLARSLRERPAQARIPQPLKKVKG
jgi:molybdate transport system regulatory protein